MWFIVLILLIFILGLIILVHEFGHFITAKKAGVHIYEYQPGFLHAKSFVCDDEIAVVGTINLDYRSLYLHFEMVYGFIKTKLSRTSCLTFRKHSITVIRSALISVGTETLSYGPFRVFFACLHLYSDIHLDEAFLQKQYPPRILTAERYCFYVS